MKEVLWGRNGVPLLPRSNETDDKKMASLACNSLMTDLGLKYASHLPNG